MKNPVSDLLFCPERPNLFFKIKIAKKLPFKKYISFSQRLEKAEKTQNFQSYCKTTDIGNIVRCKFAPANVSLTTSAPRKSAHNKLAFTKLAPRKSEPLNKLNGKFASVKLARFKFTFVNSTLFQ